MTEPAPGQFYMVGTDRGYDPLLKRAFSLFRRTPDGLQLFYRVRGKGTSLLSSMGKGEVLDIVGPLGNSYPLPNEDQILAGELGGVYENLVLCTDDGSCGIKGTVVDVLRDFMGRHTTTSSAPVVYACGPVPMLRGIAETALSLGVRGYVSLEENMACGIGACLGCVVRTKSGYRRVCKEGPVFDAAEIVW
ncbi:MAG: hypothetical protein P8Z71_11110 [Candidatus Sulfobium sp.]